MKIMFPTQSFLLMIQVMIRQMMIVISSRAVLIDLSTDLKMLFKDSY